MHEMTSQSLHLFLPSEASVCPGASAAVGGQQRKAGRLWTTILSPPLRPTARGACCLPQTTATLATSGLHCSQLTTCVVLAVPCLPSMAPEAYLDMLCPVQSRPEVRAPSEPPGGAVSLSRLKVLPVTKQVPPNTQCLKHFMMSVSGRVFPSGARPSREHWSADAGPAVLTAAVWAGPAASLPGRPAEARGAGPGLLGGRQPPAPPLRGPGCPAQHTRLPGMPHSAHGCCSYCCHVLRACPQLYCFTQSRVIARKDVAVITKVGLG